MITTCNFLHQRCFSQALSKLSNKFRRRISNIRRRRAQSVGGEKFTFFPAYLPRVMMATRPTLRTTKPRVSISDQLLLCVEASWTHTSWRLSVVLDFRRGGCSPVRNFECEVGSVSVAHGGSKAEAAAASLAVRAKCHMLMYT